jgi:hypothetical protein
MLGEPADLLLGLVTVCVAIAAFYGVTFLLNMVAGRIFCGCSCPVGQLHRLADAIDALSRDAAGRPRAWLELAAFNLLLAGATSLWWVGPGVHAVEWTAMLAALGGAGGGRGTSHPARAALALELLPQALSHRAVLFGGADRGPGAHPLRREAGLHRLQGLRRDLPGAPRPAPPRPTARRCRRHGFSDIPAANHCLSCGACIEICEHMTRKEPLLAAMGFRVSWLTSSVTNTRCRP